MKHRIEQKPAFEVVGYTLRTTTAGGKSMREIPPFWDKCLADGKVAALEKLDSAFGMLGLCAEFDPRMEAFTYVIGVEAEAGAGASAPAGTSRVQVPAATYAVFESVGPMPHSIQKVWLRAFNEWFPTSGWEHAGSPDFEVYPAFAPDDPRGDITSPLCYSEVWIPLCKRSPRNLG